mgnify:CR=1 FL=1
MSIEIAIFALGAVFKEPLVTQIAVLALLATIGVYGIVAPTEPVIDTFLISDCADVTLYLIRAGVTDKKVLEISNNLKRQGKLENMAYVLNDVHARNTKSYNYGYGEV